MAENITWDGLYQKGDAGLRHWPNEELIRFLGRRYFHRGIPNAGSHPKALEVGCGNGPNLWAMARAGFDTVGVDISPTVLPWARRKLQEWDAQADLAVADVKHLPFQPDTFDIVFDVQALECLPYSQLTQAYRAVERVTAPDGRFFSVHIGSRTWDFDHGGGELIEPHTLGNVPSQEAIFPNLGTICMPTRKGLEEALEAGGLTPVTIENVKKTYEDGTKTVEYHIVEAVPTESPAATP